MFNFKHLTIYFNFSLSIDIPDNYDFDELIFNDKPNYQSTTIRLYLTMHFNNEQILFKVRNYSNLENALKKLKTIFKNLKINTTISTYENYSDITFEEFTNLKLEIPDDTFEIMFYDEYLEIENQLFLNLIESKIF